MTALTLRDLFVTKRQTTTTQSPNPAHIIAVVVLGLFLVLVFMSTFCIVRRRQQRLRQQVQYNNQNFYPAAPVYDKQGRPMAPPAPVYHGGRHGGMHPAAAVALATA